MPAFEFFKRISAIAHERKTRSLYQLGKFEKRRHLFERLSATERDSAKALACLYLLENFFHRNIVSRIECPRLRIVAAMAMMRTALHKDNEPESRPIDDGLRLDTAHSDYF